MAKPYARLASGTALSLLVASGLLATAVTAQSVDIAEEDTEQLDTIVVTASSIATSVQDAPASISVIDSATVAGKGAARDMTEALRDIPGLNVAFGSDGTRKISFRGMPSGYTLILIDGKRVNAGKSFVRHYLSDLDWIPVDAIDRIEVVRGPMSTLYGSDAMGGVINIITKKDEGFWTGSLTVEGDFPQADNTGSSRGITGRLSGPLGENLSMSVWTAYNKRTPDADLADDGAAIDAQDGSIDRSVNARVTWTPTDSSTWEFEAGTGGQDYLTPDTDLSTQTIDRTTGSIRNVHELSFGTLTSTLAYEKAKNITPDAEISYETLTFDTTLTSETQLMGKPLSYTLGLSGMREAISDPVNLGNDDPTTGAPQSTSDSLTTTALFAEARWDLTDQLSLTGGLRVDDHEKFGAHASPRLYVNYALTEELMLKGGWSQAFVAPSMRQLNPGWGTTSRGRGCAGWPGPCWMVGNPDLQPETSDNFELGLNYQGNSGVQAELTWFRNDIDDMISVVGPATGTYNGYNIYPRVNIDHALTEGFEGGLSVPVTDDLTFTGTFTWLTKSQKDYVDPATGLASVMPLGATPEITASASLAWQVNDKLGLDVGATYVGKQVEYELADTLSSGKNIKAYTLVDLGFNYAVNDTVGIRGGVHNLFDTQPKSESAYAESGRLFTLALTTRF